jgi:hypothetical protein
MLEEAARAGMEDEFGTTHRTLGPRSGVLFPRSGGLVPRSGGLVPRSGSLVPRSGGLVPRSGSLVPRSGGLVPRPRSGNLGVGRGSSRFFQPEKSPDSGPGPSGY